MIQRIQYANIKEVRTPYVKMDTFEFRRDKKYHWLQRLLFKILATLECHSMGEKVAYDCHEFNTDDLIDNLLKQKCGILEMYDMHGSKLLMGPKEFTELTNLPLIRQTCEFTCDYHKGRQIYGLNIRIIPWMVGILVVP